MAFVFDLYADLEVMLMSNEVFWIVMRCRLVDGYHRIGESRLLLYNNRSDDEGVSSFLTLVLT
jgi:hypothetical protein